MKASGIDFPVVGNTAATGTLKQVGGIPLTKAPGRPFNTPGPATFHA